MAPYCTPLRPRATAASALLQLQSPCPPQAPDPTPHTARRRPGGCVTQHRPNNDILKVLRVPEWRLHCRAGGSESAVAESRSLLGVTATAHSAPGTASHEQTQHSTRDCVRREGVALHFRLSDKGALSRSRVLQCVRFTPLQGALRRAARTSPLQQQQRVRCGLARPSWQGTALARCRVPVRAIASLATLRDAGSALIFAMHALRHGTSLSRCSDGSRALDRSWAGV